MLLRKIFDVPEESIVGFAEILEINNLKGVILGTENGSEIKVSVSYEREEREAILELIDFIDYSEADEED